ncbi:G-protein coupled receptor 176-like isoform X1 [Anguilla anguilla]|uniref:G-protein coupled receptor 176-like isoform X1 n=2 Tax=Anguilla anguilla TaxID=7936 RepID=UPI0015A7C03E|nr:G-protein coupled receptor 176-like isoform X1 [Anguilla anguilla]
MEEDNVVTEAFITAHASGVVTPENHILELRNMSTPLTHWDNISVKEIFPLERHFYSQDRTYRDFTTAIQVLIFIGSLLGNTMVLWSTCRTSVFKSVTNCFIRNLACSGICASLVCVPFDIVLNASPHCCWWAYTLLFCKVIKFLHKLFSSVIILSFTAIALDRYYSVLYPLERKISDSKSRDLLIYIWVHAVVASVPVFAVTNVTDIYATALCTEPQSPSLGHLVYVVAYNASTVVLPLSVVFVLMVLIRRALSASQKKKVIIAALRTPQNSISIPYVSQREAELHAMLLSMVLTFLVCSVPYATLVVYRLAMDAPELSTFLLLTAVWLPKVSLLANPLLFLTVNRSVRKCLLGTLAQLHRRYSRRNAVRAGGLVEVVGEPGVRSGSQLLEMFNIGQQQIFQATEEDEENEVRSVASGDFQHSELEQAPPPSGLGLRPSQPQAGAGGPGAGGAVPKCSPLHGCAESSSQVAPAMPLEGEEGGDKYTTQMGFGPFELPPQWLSETRNSKKRLLPPLGNTPEELIQTKQPKIRTTERRISRNNKVSIFPIVDP